MFSAQNKKKPIRQRILKYVLEGISRAVLLIRSRTAIKILDLRLQQVSPIIIRLTSTYILNSRFSQFLLKEIHLL